MIENGSKSVLLAVGLGALLIVMVVYSISNAQWWGWGGGHNNGGRAYMGYGGWDYDTVPQKYRLSDDQFSKVREIRSDYYERIAPLGDKLESLTIEFQSYISNPDADEGKIRSIRAEIRDQEDRIDDLRLEASVKIRKILSADQLSYYGDGYDWFDDHWDMCRDNVGYGKMMDGPHSMMSSWGCW